MSLSEILEMRKQCSKCPEINWEEHRFLDRENRWNLWIMSPQYAKAFKIYWSNQGFPLEIYPTWLLSNDTNGLKYEPLIGKHRWLDDPYNKFQESRIYNEQLHIWVHKLMYEHYVDVAVRQDDFVKKERWYYPNRKGFYVQEYL